MKKKIEVAMPESEKDFEAEDAAKTVMTAHKHMQDPAMRKRMKKHLASHKKAIDSAMGSMPMDDMDEDDQPQNMDALKKIRNKKVGGVSC